MWGGFFAACFAFCCGGPAALLSWEPAPPEQPLEAPEIDALAAQAQALHPAPERELEHYLDYARARLERDLDLEGAATASLKALSLDPGDPRAVLLLLQVSGASGGRAGLSLDQAQQVLAVTQEQEGVDPAELALAVGWLALATGDSSSSRSALSEAPESWRRRRLELELALETQDLDRAERLAESLAQAFELDGARCRVSFRTELGAGRLQQAEDLANACLGEGIQAPGLQRELAELADRTGRPAVAIARYAAAGLTEDAATLRWQEGLGTLPQARGQLRGASASAQSQRAWIALYEGDIEAAWVESDGLEGPARAAVALERGVPPAEVLEMLPGQDPASAVLKARAALGSPQELLYWQAAVATEPSNPEIYRAWLGMGSGETLPAALDALAQRPLLELAQSPAALDRDTPWHLIAGPSWLEILQRVDSDTVRLLAGETEDIQDPLVAAYGRLREGEPQAADRLLGQVPREQRGQDWTIARAMVLLEGGEATAAQALVLPLLRDPGGRRAVVACFHARGQAEEALSALAPMLQERPWDTAIWSLALEISSTMGADPLDSKGPAQ
ncbi:MAG: hypothetical protein VX899_07850 [Myxococcota bacterium]|nr:hypothetical protein [Myxococcota bacterium]